jgi:predicted DNA-binding transcriptional regulator AlpA
VRDELQSVLEVIRTLPAIDLPRLLGELEEVRTTALARLTAPAPVEALADRVDQDVLDVAGASAFIGMSQKWIYRHYEILPHLRLGFGKRPRLRFRRNDLSAWLEQHRMKLSKH